VPVDAEDERMGSMSIWHWIVVLAVGLLLFGGRGKISELMGDFAKGIKSFKKGLSEEDKAETQPGATDPMKTINHEPAPPTAPTSAPAGSPGAGSASTTTGAEPRKV
jgi:sec-independent protein translocase protein TatA